MVERENVPSGWSTRVRILVEDECYAKNTHRTSDCLCYGNWLWWMHQWLVWDYTTETRTPYWLSQLACLTGDMFWLQETFEYLHSIEARSVASLWGGLMETIGQFAESQYADSMRYKVTFKVRRNLPPLSGGAATPTVRPHTRQVYFINRH